MSRLLPESFPRAVALATDFVAVATIDAVTHPAPLPVGEQLLVWDGGVAGSVSAGCVDGDVVATAALVLADGRPRTRVYRPDGSPIAPTTCGGTLRVGIERLPVAAGPAAVLAAIDERKQRSAPHRHRPRRLFLLGATTLAARLARIAASLDFRVIVLDPRPDFATHVQVPGAHDVRCEWPQRALAQAELTYDDAVVLLSHDERFAAAALAVALGGAAGYVGALGSAATADGYRSTLRTLGVPDDSIAALRSPVGLAIGAADPAQIAVAIAAELVDVYAADRADCVTAGAPPASAPLAPIT